MKVYTVEKETNRIALHGCAQEARRIQNAECFRDEAEFEEIASGWTTARLIAIWNSLAGVTPVSRFKDRATGVPPSGRTFRTSRANRRSRHPERT